MFQEKSNLWVAGDLKYTQGCQKATPLILSSLQFTSKSEWDQMFPPLGFFSKRCYFFWLSLNITGMSPFLLFFKILVWKLHFSSLKGTLLRFVSNLKKKKFNFSIGFCFLNDSSYREVFALRGLIWAFLGFARLFWWCSYTKACIFSNRTIISSLSDIMCNSMENPFDIRMQSDCVSKLF